jgi:hypothetical protein
VLFDEPDKYFAPDSDSYYQQGDIVLAPAVVLESSPHAVTQVATGRPTIGERLVTPVWDETPLGAESGRLVSTVRLCPVAITTHDCTLDKEFNRTVESLRAKERLQLAEAVALAASDLSLDRYVNVAPLVPLSEAAPSAPTELRHNKVLGYFPVCRDDMRGVDESVVDLVQESTIDRELIVARIAVLSEAARAALRYSLARYWVYRGPRLGFEIEDAVGKRIEDVAISNDGALAVDLTLSDGSKLRFLQAPHVAEAGSERPGMR